MSRTTFIIALCTIIAAQAKFPDDPKPCKYGDSECLLKTINYFVSEKHKEGDRSINLVKLDPLPVAKMNINQGADSPVNIDLTFTNNNLLGIGDITFIGVKGFGKNIDKKHELKFKVPRLSLVGPYDIKGKVLILPISGSGKSNMTMVNAELTFSFTGKSVEKNGEMYMEATNVNLLTKPERCYYQFSNLFNGDKALGDNMNAFLNDNWEAIFKEVQDSMQSAFAEIFKAILEKAFTKYPYAKYFEDS